MLQRIPVKDGFTYLKFLVLKFFYPILKDCKGNVSLFDFQAFIENNSYLDFSGNSLAWPMPNLGLRQ
jgi:hypothetical protein